MNNSSTFEIVSKKITLRILVLFSTFILGCGSGGGNQGDKTGSITPIRVDVTTQSSIVTKGSTITFAAAAIYKEGDTPTTVTSDVTWETIPANIATINSNGVATGTAVGKTTVTATIAGVKSTQKDNLNRAS